MSYQQLNPEERLELYRLKQTTNLSIRGIAKKMGRSHATISRELRRNQHPELESYLPDTAQSQAVERRQQAKLPFAKFTPNVIEEVSVKVERLSQPGTDCRSPPTIRDANGEPRDYLSDDLSGLSGNGHLCPQSPPFPPPKAASPSATVKTGSDSQPGGN